MKDMAEQWSCGEYSRNNESDVIMPEDTQDGIIQDTALWQNTPLSGELPFD